MTPGCQGCVKANAGATTAVNHTEVCRKRLIEELRKAGDRRVILRDLDMIPEAPIEVPVLEADETEPAEEEGEIYSLGDIGNVVYSITADNTCTNAVSDKLQNNIHQDKRWNDDMQVMNDKLKEKGFDHSIIEVYSPRRVTAMAEAMGLMPGMSLDLTGNDTDGKPWDFNNAEKRDRARHLVGSKQALLVIGSPMCSAFSSLQNINFARMTPEEVEKVKAYGKVHLDFCAELYQEQINNHLYFLHEHPHDATSWKEDSIKDLLAQENVVKVCFY